MVLSYLLMLVTVGLSWVFRTIYLTILMTLSIYFVPFLWQVVQAFTSWQPSLYFHIESELMGDMAAKTGLSGVFSWKGLILFLVSFLLIEAIFNKFFDRIQTQSHGLQRRIST